MFCHHLAINRRSWKKINTHIKKTTKRRFAAISENAKICCAMQEFLFIFIDRQFLKRFLYRIGNILVLLLLEKNLGGLCFLSDWLPQRKLGLFLKIENCQTLNIYNTKLGRNLKKKNSNSTTAMSFLFTNWIRMLYLQR